MIKITAISILLFILVACGSGSDESAAMGGAPMAGGGDVLHVEEAPIPLADSAWSGAYGVAENIESSWETPDIHLPTAVERRVIRNSEIALETLDFGDTVSRVERIVEMSGGFVESSAHRSMTTRDGEIFWSGDYVIRTPVARFDEVNGEIAELGSVVHFTTASEDVTMMFLDLQSRLHIREEEERRVEAMRDAATDLRDLLTLERELSDLRVVVDRYRRRMTEIDQLASFSTIRLTIIEVEEIIYIPAPLPPPDDSFGTRLANAFRASANFGAMLFEVVAILVVSLIIPLSVLAIPSFGGYLIYKKVRRKA
ncbi:MAG: DUF4349 domain-containing protein [Defluviitaleaceae bacterium]|nr:DUF4349 domain-containing protein [Defluviitaleaceae bacterium]